MFSYTYISATKLLSLREEKMRILKFVMLSPNAPPLSYMNAPICPCPVCIVRPYKFLLYSTYVWCGGHAQRIRRKGDMTS
jgi:hypothetical protein